MTKGKLCVLFSIGGVNDALDIQFEKCYFIIIGRLRLLPKSLKKIVWKFVIILNFL